MTAPVSVLLAVFGVVVSARIRLTAVVFGRPVSVSLLDLAAIVVVLVLIALVLFLVRCIIQDGGLRLRPRVVTR